MFSLFISFGVSGCRTICINPDEVETVNSVKTDFNNSKKWHAVKRDVTNISDILPLIDKSLKINSDESVC